MIFNMGSGASNAEAVQYDNSDSNLTSDNVQDAINELSNDKVNTEYGKGLSTNDYTTEEKTKLSGIATGANKTVVDTALSTSSTNPVQNKAVATALNGKVSVVSGMGLSQNSYTTDEKTKLAGIATGATKNVIDSALSTSSTNAIQNKVVATNINTINSNLASGKVKFKVENGKLYYSINT